MLPVRSFGQLKPSTFSINSQTPATTRNVDEVAGSGNGLTGSIFNLRYGQEGEGQSGINRIIQRFTVSDLVRTYVPVPASGGQPYSHVILNQRALGFPQAEQDIAKEVSFAESSPQDGPNLYVLPEHSFTMEGVINSYIINRGIDNSFANFDGNTINTVERIDMVYEGGITASEVTKSGFLVMERGGNDSFKAAAITELNPDGTVKSLGQLIEIGNASWQSSGVDIQSLVLQKSGETSEWTPTELLASQSISGTYITFQDLGIASGTEIFGYALFPGDVTDEMDLLGLTDVPGNTPASGTGGLDYMGGGGFFVALVNVSGNIYNDGNGGSIDGSPTNVNGTMYVSLVKDGTVYATQQVANDGSYLFTNVEAGSYTAVVHTSSTGSLTAQLPSDNWIFTGEGTGTTPDASINGGTEIVVGEAGTADIINVNFAIQQKPTAVPQEYTLATQPSVDAEITLNGTGTGTSPDNVSPGPLRGSDPEDQPMAGSLEGKQVIITSQPDNGELYYDGELITTLNIPFSVDSYDPDLLTLKLTGAGFTSVSFNYAYIDSNGEQSSPVTYKINFPSGALPVKLVDFTVALEQNNALLSWFTASETNSGHFEVEHSPNGKTWGIIGSINALGESQSVERYTFVHNALPNGLNYYRLKMIDLDESYAYSKIIYLNNPGSDQAAVYPNPASGFVKIDNEGKSVERVKVLNQAGAFLIEPKFKENTVDLSSLAAGTYIISVTYSDNITSAYQLIVQ
jgi:hypothetical protein